MAARLPMFQLGSVQLVAVGVVKRHAEHLGLNLVKRDGVSDCRRCEYQRLRRETMMPRATYVSSVDGASVLPVGGKDDG